MKFSLIPREYVFFDLLEKAAGYLVECATLLDALSRDFTDLDGKVARIEEIETACDKVTHLTLEKLESTFITPLDREDIHELIHQVDEFVDMTTSAAGRLTMFRVTIPRKGLDELGNIILRQARLIASALVKLRNPKNYSQVVKECIELHGLESEGDKVRKRVVRDLFDHETNAIDLMRWKEIFEKFETVTDCGEAVANVLQGIVVKQS